MGFQQKLAAFMQGRYGGDEMTKFFAVVPLVLMVPAAFLMGVAKGIPGYALWGLAVLLIVWNTWRIFSRNTEARRRENVRFLYTRNKLVRFFRTLWEKLRHGSQYRYFKCPACKTELRVPRHKGNIRITCAKCGEKFVRKT